MGLEATCWATFGGRRGRGRAFLESDDVVFRGPFRVRVPLRHLNSAVVTRGRLELAFGDTALGLELGPAAERWRERILRPKGRLEKLGTKALTTVAVLGIEDASFRAELVAAGLRATRSARAPGATVFLGVDARAGLDRIRSMRAAIAPAGALWVVYPKGRDELREADVLTAGRAAGLVDVKVVRFSETHTALKFVVRTPERRRLAAAFASGPPPGRGRAARRRPLPR